MAVFALPLEVRGYECRPGGVVALPQVLSYLEHCRWKWMLEDRLGLLELLQSGHFFVAHRANLALARTFGAGTRVQVRAALRNVGRVTCEVEQDVVREDGVLLAKAHITAVWLSPAGRMARVPDVTRAAVTDAALHATTAAPTAGRSYLRPAERCFEADVVPWVQREVPEHAATTSLRVRPSDCDAFEHVNNANYLRYFEDALGTSAVAADVEYRGQARARDVLELLAWEDAASSERRAFALRRGDEVLCRAVLRPMPLAHHEARGAPGGAS